jgi:hypothetical protein
MKNTTFWLVLFAVLLCIPFTQLSAQQDNPYEEGTVWTLTFIRTGPNKADDYLKDLAKTWVASMEEAKAEGLILDYKILQGNAANEDDYNLILMTENKSLADFDPDKDRDAKWDAIEKKLKDQMGDKFDTMVKNYDAIREMKGTKIMRELHLKK